VVKPVILLYGKEEYLKEKALGDLASKVLDENTRVFNYAHFYGDEARARDIIDCAATAPLGGSRRFIVVRRLERMRSEERDILKDAISAIAKCACLVLETSSEKMLEEFEPLKRFVEIIGFDRPSEAQRSRLIASLLAPQKKSITPDAARLVSECAGDSIDHLVIDLEKLVTYSGTRMTITAEDVETIIGRDIAYSAFDLTDAIGYKDGAQALRVVKELVSRGRRSYEIIGALSWHLKRLLWAHDLLKQGKNHQQVIAALRVSGRFRDKFLSHIRQFKRKELREKLTMLLSADIDIKTSRIDEGVSLEMTVLKLCL